MSTGSIIWIVLFIISAIMFFGIAISITFYGFKDLKDLLSKTDKK